MLAALDAMFPDNVKGRRLQADGTYTAAAGARRGAVPIAARAVPRGEARDRPLARGGRRQPRAAALAGRVSAGAPPPEPELTAAERALLEQGVAQFNDRLFFECHDTLEDLWSGLRGPSRSFFQGLIQTAVGFYHLGNGNRAGAARLFERALARLGAYPQRYAGLETAPLRAAVRRPGARPAASDGPLPPEEPPLVSLSRSPRGDA